MRVLEGKYQLVAPIASGGMASVHLGRLVGRGGFEREVAIKLMHPHLAAERSYVDMFLDEARLAARIRHPNVVSTLDVGEVDGEPFIVMEYVEGPTLAQVLRALRKRQTPMPIPIALRIFDDALAGLHAAHELRNREGMPLQLVHRDVSPQNIMIGLDGISRLSDFGVARAEVRLSSTRSGELKGKLAYLPPEQLEGHGLDRRADIYAAGAVLWEALVGRRLFRAESEAELLRMLLAGAQLAPKQLREDVPEAISDACIQALRLNPQERFPSAAAFAEALERAAAESGVRAASGRALGRFISALAIDVAPQMPTQALVDPLSGTPSFRIDKTEAPFVGTAPRPTSRSSYVALGLGGVAMIVGVTLAWRSQTPTPASSPAVSADAVPNAVSPTASLPSASAATDPTNLAPGSASAGAEPEGSATADVPPAKPTTQPKPPRRRRRAAPPAPPPPPPPAPPSPPPNKDYEPDTL